MDHTTQKMKKLNKIHMLVSEWTQFDVGRRLSKDLPPAFEYHENAELLACTYEAYGVNLLEDTTNNEKDAKQFMHASFKMWKSILETTLTTESKIEALFHLSCTGTLSENDAETRMILNGADFGVLYQDISRESWPSLLKNTVLILFLLLIRKQNGWSDLKLFDSVVADLYKLQNDLERSYLLSIEQKDYPLRFAYEVAGLLNIFEALEMMRQFLQTGKPNDIEVKTVRCCRDAVDFFEHSINSEFKINALLIEYTLKTKKKSSIWANLSGISEKIDSYVRYLTAPENEEPIFDLWPSQIEALRNSLLDNSKISINIEMPTSSGKTFLSKLIILQSLNLYPDGKIAYLVPTRALVNQVKKSLKSDLGLLDVKVEIALPIIDLAPLEEEFLKSSIHVLVTTPEKLDLLIRAQHPLTNDLKLVIVDEAHTIDDQSGARGSKLELLLATLRKECTGARIRLLSPFIANGKKLASWLGGEQSHSIEVNWKPAEQFTGYYSLTRRGRGNYSGEVEYIPSILNRMYINPFEIKISDYTKKNIRKSELAKHVAEYYKSLGGVLVLARDPRTAENIAAALIEKTDIVPYQDKLMSLMMSIKNEYGENYLLYDCVKRGIAFHHSGLSLDIREQIEDAIVNRLINLVVATTTLAQGMNFPISTVVFQSCSIPQERYSRRMTDAEFWNIAGRAGRAMVDQEGHVIMVGSEVTDRTVFEGYLEKRKTDVKSSLFGILDFITDNMEFNFKLLRDSKAMSAFLQYIYHFLSSEEKIEIEDLLRGSLLYHQLVEDKNRSSVESIIKMVSQYTNLIAKDINNKNYMKVIDRTGLSNISMGFLRNCLREQKLRITYQDLISTSDILARSIEIIDRVPEIKLGIYEQRGQLNPELIAAITKDWIGGCPIGVIAQRHIHFKQSIDQKIQHCGRYIHGRLVNNLSWGISALQTAQSLGDTKEISLEDKLLPTFIYFGVKSKEAAVMSMFGVKRALAETIGETWRKEKGDLTIENIKLVEPWLREKNIK